MAELQDPQYLEGGSHTAQGDRLVLSSLVATDGIVGAADLVVTERAGTADMSVDVAAGAAFIGGTESSTQGIYHVFNDASVNLAVAAANATDPRIDLVVAQVRDAFYSGVSDDWQLAVITGTAAATPVEPAVPDNALVLARIDVGAGAGSVTNADITDRRTAATPGSLDMRLWAPADRTGTAGSEADYIDHGGMLTIPNPGYEVMVYTTLVIMVTQGPAVNETFTGIRLMASLDGGATWSENTGWVEGNPTHDKGSGSVQVAVQGTPSGDIMLKVASRRFDSQGGAHNVLPMETGVFVKRA